MIAQFILYKCGQARRGSIVCVDFEKVVLLGVDMHEGFKEGMSEY